MRAFLTLCNSISLIAVISNAQSSFSDDAEQSQQTDHNEMSLETMELLNSHLLYVYDEGGCRAMEGLNHHHGSTPLHRVAALTELGRRLRNQIRGEARSRTLYNYDSEEAADSTTPNLETVYLDTLGMEIAKVPEGFSLTDFEDISEGLPCVKFVSRDDVKYVENSDSTHLRGGATDPLYRYQWALKGPQTGAGFGIDIEPVWRNYKPQGETLIAIIDSGCTQSHPDMRGQFWKNPGEKSCNDGKDDDGNGYIDDCFGWDFVKNTNTPAAEGQTSHGTAAAGIIAASTNNKQGIAGICPSCKLICLRFISNTEGTVVNEVRAIDYAIKMGARISNNSYGGYTKHGSKVEKEAIARAHKHGHLFVSSAGNNNLATDQSDYVHTPSGYALPNIISVGASTENGRKTQFSNYGKETVHVFAPGRNIISTGKDGYVVNQGTSFAAPHVAGIAGLIWSSFPTLSNVEVWNAVVNSCRRTPELEDAASCGGIVDAVKAMEMAEQMAARHNSHSIGLFQEPVPNDLDTTFIGHGSTSIKIGDQHNVNQGQGAPSYMISASSLYQVLPAAKKLLNAPGHAFREVARRAESSVERFSETVRKASWENLLPIF